MVSLEHGRRSLPGTSGSATSNSCILVIGFQHKCTSKVSYVNQYNCFIEVLDQNLCTKKDLPGSNKGGMNTTIKAWRRAVVMGIPKFSKEDLQGGIQVRRSILLQISVLENVSCIHCLSQHCRLELTAICINLEIACILNPLEQNSKLSNV